uniref:Integrin alpha-1 Alpha1, Transmembrane Region, Detergent n=1 Tax=Myoviridae sp. ctKhy9 TaxID=2827677 RepID=A0A8S5SJW6_9CAUD|nr:MAG TPA: Integrin alpha-1 Alpha1, Transmembrane Region, Detergent [Myoviridae sp. ctKhy9]
MNQRCTNTPLIWCTFTSFLVPIVYHLSLIYLCAKVGFMKKLIIEITIESNF